jgi:hypothetical protein
MADNNQVTSALNADLNAPIANLGGGYQQLLKEEQRLGMGKAQAEADVEKAKLTAQQAGLEAAKGVDEKTRQQVEDLKSKVSWEDPAFHPTEENAMSLGSLFSMVATMGVMLGSSGKLSGINALNAMGGMLKGWQQGRKDLYNQEKDKWNMELKRLQDLRENIKYHIEQAQKLGATDRERASQEAQIASSLAGPNSVIAAQLKNGQFDASLKTIEGAKALQLEITKHLLAKRDQKANYQYFTKDGKTYAVNTSNPNDIREVPFDLAGASKLGSAKGDQPLKKGEYVANFVGNSIGKKVDPDVASKFANTVNYMSKLDHLKELSRGLGTKSGFAAEVASFVNKFVVADIDKYAEDDPQTGKKIITDASMQKIIDDAERSKTFVGFSENAKQLSKAQLDTVMSYLQSKYGNRAPVIEFKAAANALTRENMDAVTFEKVMNDEKASSVNLIATMGFNAQDYNNLRSAIDKNKEGFDNINRPETGAKPLETVGSTTTQKHYLRGREIVPNANNTGWVFADDGTEAK